MTTTEFLTQMNAGARVEQGSELHLKMTQLSDEAMQITSKLNSSYHTREQIVALMSELTEKEIDNSFAMFPPFYTDCGKNIHLGRNVFINSGCHFQDQGGIIIADDVLIGHCVTLATLNHGIAPDDRHSLYPQPIVIGANVWIGAGVTVVAGVTIGANSIVAAGAVVTRNVAPNTVVAGVPAKVIKRIE